MKRRKFILTSLAAGAAYSRAGHAMRRVAGTRSAGAPILDLTDPDWVSYVIATSNNHIDGLTDLAVPEVWGVDNTGIGQEPTWVDHDNDGTGYYRQFKANDCLWMPGAEFPAIWGTAAAWTLTAVTRPILRRSPLGIISCLSGTSDRNRVTQFLFRVDSSDVASLGIRYYGGTTEFYSAYFSYKANGNPYTLAEGEFAVVTLSSSAATGMRAWINGEELYIDAIQTPATHQVLNGPHGFSAADQRAWTLGKHEVYADYDGWEGFSDYVAMGIKQSVQSDADVTAMHAYWMNEFLTMDKVGWKSGVDATDIGLQYDFTSDMNDSASGGFDLTAFGNAKITTGLLTNPAEGVLDLDGTGDYAYNNAFTYPADLPFGLSVWARTDVAANYDTICNFNDATTAYGWLAMNGGTQFLFQHKTDVITASTLSPNTIATGTWYHIFAVFDQYLGTAYFYMNGALSQSVAVHLDASAITYRGQALTHIIMGARYKNSPNWYWDGYLSRFKMFNYAPKAADVLALYDAEKSNYPGHL